VRAAAVALPWRLPRLPELEIRAWLAQVRPTRRSLALGLGIFALALGGYLLARETSLFAIDRIEVEGGSGQVAGQVRRALASFAGRPLVGLDGSAVLQRVDALPTVVRSSYDRAFPHTLRITIVPERPAAVLRSGRQSWLVSARGRVMERLPSRTASRLPRIWVSAHAPVQVGQTLAAAEGTAARALGLAGSFAARITTASYTNGALVFHLRSGLEVLLGDAGDLEVKLVVAQRALALVPAGSTYLDVSIPGRAVAGTGSPLLALLRSSSRG
jgi:cell division protein FtsQ